MACYYPLRAYRTRSGSVVLGKEAPDSAPLALPCGGCLGCRKDRARGWALRCHLELSDPRNRDRAVFSTLTYADHSLPPTLQKGHLSGFIKRLRSSLGGGVRFFASGEYGDRTARPHYHAILYGVAESDRRKVEDAWGLGHTRTEPVTPRRIAYVAGYVNKKVGWRLEPRERVDPETGEVYTWEPPFVLMSRRPGIGAHGRSFKESWRLFGVHQGKPIPVPRYLHAAWRDNATALETETLDYEKSQHRLTLNRDLSPARLEAAAAIALAKHSIDSSRRAL